MAIKRDRALHEQALAIVARHLNTPTPRQGGAQIPQIMLPPAQQMLVGRGIDQFIK
jgi:hypothetical protein